MTNYEMKVLHNKHKLNLQKVSFIKSSQSSVLFTFYYLIDSEFRNKNLDDQKKFINNFRNEFSKKLIQITKKLDEDIIKQYLNNDFYKLIQQKYDDKFENTTDYIKNIILDPKETLDDLFINLLQYFYPYIILIIQHKTFKIYTYNEIPFIIILY